MTWLRPGQGSAWGGAVRSAVGRPGMPACAQECAALGAGDGGAAAQVVGAAEAQALGESALEPPASDVRCDMTQGRDRRHDGCCGEAEPVAPVLAGEIADQVDSQPCRQRQQAERQEHGGGRSPVRGDEVAVPDGTVGAHGAGAPRGMRWAEGGPAPDYTRWVCAVRGGCVGRSPAIRIAGYWVAGAQQLVS